jgi:hypothetical protein
LLPDLGLRHTVIERTFTRLVEQLLHFMNLDLLFLDEIWFVLGVSPTSWVYSTVFYGFSLPSSLSFFVFFSSSAYRSSVHLRHSFLPTFIIYFSRPSSLFISPREDQTVPRMRQFLLRPTQATVRCYARTSIEIDASVFLESLFGDTFWSIRMEHGHRLEHFFGICFVNGV